MSKAKDIKDEDCSKMSEIGLNVLIKFIGTFDGSRDKLTPFLNNCRNAILLAANSQTDILLKYILSRLEGKAETACAIKEFSKWSQLEEFLKSQFGDAKHYAYLLSDLQECKQGRNESVSQYSLRVESCLAKLLTEINISIPTKKKDELSGRVAAMQDLALNVFMIGLQPQLSTVVRCRDPNNLNEAINLATAEEKIMGITNRKFLSPSNTPNRFEQGKQNYNNTSFSRPHFTAPTQPRPNTNSPICRYCKNIGHTIENCRKREFNNKRFGSNQHSYGQNSQEFQRRTQPIHCINASNPEAYDEVKNDPNNLNE